jgi:hypothetical protein
LRTPTEIRSNNAKNVTSSEAIGGDKRPVPVLAKVATGSGPVGKESLAWGLRVVGSKLNESVMRVGSGSKRRRPQSFS